jgi:hypothetical protein
MALKVNQSKRNFIGKDCFIFDLILTPPPLSPRKLSRRLIQPRVAVCLFLKAQFFILFSGNVME